MTAFYMGACIPVYGYKQNGSWYSVYISHRNGLHILVETLLFLYIFFNRAIFCTFIDASIDSKEGKIDGIIR